MQKPSLFDRLTTLLGWTPHSIYVMSVFFLACGLIVYVWWPLAVAYLSYIDWQGAWWRYIDWLLIGNFLVMSLLIMARADLRRDAKIAVVGMLGGLAIEGWGTQTNLWFYYTAERPPLWIIPAWPIASLAIDRLVQLFDQGIDRLSPSGGPRHASRVIYWGVFLAFLVLMARFIAPTADKSLTILSALACVLIILSPTHYRLAVLNFIAGSALGYFLELWGTTRQCWTYYTYQTPPLFAVLAHGMAAVAFWRAGLLLERWLPRLLTWLGRARLPEVRAFRPEG